MAIKICTNINLDSEVVIIYNKPSIAAVAELLFNGCQGMTRLSSNVEVTCSDLLWMLFGYNFQFAHDKLIELMKAKLV